MEVAKKEPANADLRTIGGYPKVPICKGAIRIRTALRIPVGDGALDVPISSSLCEDFIHKVDFISSEISSVDFIGAALATALTGV